MSLHHAGGHGPSSEHATGFARIDDVEGGRPLFPDTRFDPLVRSIA